MKDKRYDELKELVDKICVDMRTIKEVHIHMAQQIQGLKGVAEQLNMMIMKQGELMGTFTKSASDNSELLQVLGDEVKAAQVDGNAYRNELQTMNVRMGAVEKMVKESFRKLSDAFRSVGVIDS